MGDFRVPTSRFCRPLSCQCLVVSQLALVPGQLRSGFCAAETVSRSSSGRPVLLPRFLAAAMPSRALGDEPPLEVGNRTKDDDV